MRGYLQWFIPVLALAALTLVACGDSGASPEPSPTTEPDSNINLPPPEFLTPAPPPPVDPEAAFVQHQNRNPQYTIEYPADWTVEEGELGMTRFVLETETRGLIAETRINCVVTLAGGDIDPKAVLQQDAQILQASQARFATDEARELTINGRTAYLFPYTVDFSDFVSKQWVYYIAGEECAWRIRNVVFGTLPMEGYDELFARMADSFSPVE